MDPTIIEDINRILAWDKDNYCFLCAAEIAKHYSDDKWIGEDELLAFVQEANKIFISLVCLKLMLTGKAKIKYDKKSERVLISGEKIKEFFEQKDLTKS